MVFEVNLAIPIPIPIPFGMGYPWYIPHLSGHCLGLLPIAKNGELGSGRGQQQVVAAGYEAGNLGNLWNTSQFRG